VYLVQLLLPLYDNEGNGFPADYFADVRRVLTERFGGLTTYSRAPAQGVWSDDDGPPRHDDIVVYEVMTDQLERAWWRAFRQRLEQQFAQDELVVRSQEIERL
jgi:hypothetical protein